MKVLLLKTGIGFITCFTTINCFAQEQVIKYLKMSTIKMMHLLKGIQTICIVLFLVLFAHTAKAQEFTSYVDPTIGSGGHGHVFVGASVPFDAVQVGPDNIFKGWDWRSGYHYSDRLIIGFAQTHLSGTGIDDSGDVLIMPYTGNIRVSKGSEKNPDKEYNRNDTKGKTRM